MKKEEGRYVARKFTDNLYSINVGIEIKRANEENRMVRSLNRDLFKPSFFRKRSNRLCNSHTDETI